MMGAQEQTGSGSGGTSARPGGWSHGNTDGEARRGPGLWTAVLAFGLLVAMAALGLKILRERGVPPGASEFPSLQDESIEATSVMGSREYDAGTVEFRTVTAVAVMGHTVLDLRHAQVRGGRAVIDAVAIMGHVEIIVPSDWEVATGDMLTAGSVSNLARRSSAESPIKVRIDGVVLMGRLDVRRD